MQMRQRGKQVPILQTLVQVYSITKLKSKVFTPWEPIPK